MISSPNLNEMTNSCIESISKLKIYSQDLLATDSLKMVSKYMWYIIIPSAHATRLYCKFLIKDKNKIVRSIS